MRSFFKGALFILVLAAGTYIFLVREYPAELARLKSSAFKMSANLSALFDKREEKVAIPEEPVKELIWCEKRCFWISRSGAAFSEAPETEGELIRKIVSTADRDIETNSLILEEEKTKNLFLIVSFLESLKSSFSDIEVGDLKKEEAEVKVSGGPKIYFSLRVDPKFGAPVVAELIKTGEWRRIEYLDLRVGNRAYYR